MINNLAASYWQAKRLDKSVPLFEELVKSRTAQLGREHPDTLLAVANLGVNYKDAGRLNEGLPLLEESFRASAKHPSLIFVGGQLLDGYAKAGKTPEAAKLADTLLESLRQSRVQETPESISQIAFIGASLLQASAYSHAEDLVRECLTIRERIEANRWTTFNTKSMLGGALVGQAQQLQATDAAAAIAKFTEAEPLLVQGYEGMQQRVATVPPEGKIRPIEALQRLVDLYAAWGKPDEAAKWQQKLEEAKAAEAQAADATAAEGKSGEARADDAKTEQTKPVDKQADEAAPTQAKAEEATKSEPAPENKKE